MDKGPLNLNDEVENPEIIESYELGSPIVYNSKVNLTYSPSQDLLSGSSPRSAFMNSSGLMSKQLKEMIVQEREAFIKRCEDIRKQVLIMQNQLSD